MSYWKDKRFRRIYEKWKKRIKRKQLSLKTKEMALQEYRTRYGDSAMVQEIQQDKTPPKHPHAKWNWDKEPYLIQIGNNFIRIPKPKKKKDPIWGNLA